jgi:hypothetical protein
MDFELERTVAVLERTPRVLDAWLRGLPDGWAVGNEGGETWSPYDVVGHLVDGEETDWMVRVRIVLQADADRRFAPVDRVRHRQAERQRPLDERLDRFAELRAANLAELRALRLGPAELARTGQHPAFGTVTLRQLLATWAAHDLGHIAQVGRVMAKQYRDAVGPWEAYLPVLHR